MSISIKYVHDMVSFMIDKTHHKAQRRGDIDIAAYAASLTLFGELKQEYELTSTISEYMSVFEAVEKYSAISSPNGFFEKPTDYNRYIKITESNGFPVSVVKNNEWDRRSNHPIKFPASKHAIARIGKDTIEVLPNNIKIHLYYFKNPQAPKYVESISGDYDPNNSIGLEWSMDMWPRLCNLILSNLGINLSEQQIINYSEMQKQ